MTKTPVTLRYASRFTYVLLSLLYPFYLGLVIIFLVLFGKPIITNSLHYLYHNHPARPHANLREFRYPTEKQTLRAMEEICVNFGINWEELRMRRVRLMMELRREEEEKLGGSSDPEALRARLEGMQVERKPITCNVCLQPEHPLGKKCPLIKSAQEDSVVGPFWRIVCRCCKEENTHPGDKNVRRRAAMKFCGNCCAIGDHSAKDCPCPPVQPFSVLRKDG